MKKLMLAGTLLLCSFSMAKEAPWFSGKIVYHNTFKTLAGADITAKLAPILGSDDPYYISDNNYKMYTEKRQLVELYTGKTNKFLFFMKGEAMPPLDAATGTVGTVKLLSQTATIAGYPCQSLQITNDEDGNTTQFFYSAKLRVNPERFARHSLGDFYTYLKAANGGVPLRMVVTNTKQGFVMVSEATSVQAMHLAAADFTPEAPAR